MRDSHVIVLLQHPRSMNVLREVEYALEQRQCQFFKTQTNDAAVGFERPIVDTNSEQTVDA
jgi:hypothetical protein